MNHSVPLAANFTAVSKSESREFMSVFPGKIVKCICVKILFKFIFFEDLVRDLTDKTKKYDRSDVPKWFAKVSASVKFYL